MTNPISTKLYAPQARLVDLATGKVLGATTAVGASGGGRSNQVVSSDIISAKVTLTNTGIGQLNVTLNNQRAGYDRMPNGGPIFPPWKYNDFSTARAQLDSSGIGGITFGQRLRLDMRYGDGDWVKMIIAQVNDLQFSFPASGASQVVVVGEDLTSLLKIKPRADKNHERKQEEEIVTAVWEKVLEEAPSSGRPTVTFVDGARDAEGRTQPLRSVRHQKSTTYFQFLQEMADRLDYEMHMEFKNVTAAADTAVGRAAGGEITVESELQFFFEPARSGNPPIDAEMDGLDQEDGEFHYVLRWGRSLIEFTPKLKVFDLPTAADAMGTNPGQRQRQSESLTESELDDLFESELPLTPNYDGPMKSALQARIDYVHAAGVSGENNDSSQGSNLDPPRLKRKAMASFMKKVREFLTADGSVIGLPRLRPGTYVDIVGLRPPFDGYYYITKTVHSLDSGGYKTQFSVRRPGLLPPEAYLDEPAGGDVS